MSMVYCHKIATEKRSEDWFYVLVETTVIEANEKVKVATFFLNSVYIIFKKVVRICPHKHQSEFIVLSGCYGLVIQEALAGFFFFFETMEEETFLVAELQLDRSPGWDCTAVSTKKKRVPVLKCLPYLPDSASNDILLLLKIKL